MDVEKARTCCGLFRSSNFHHSLNKGTAHAGNPAAFSN
jgi:hypothetical protein